MSVRPTALTTADAVAAFVTDAGAAGRRVIPSGSGTKLAWNGHSQAASAPFSTRALQQGLHHFAGDLVAVMPAGLTLNEVNAALAPAGQWLPLDPAWPDRATIGGIVATNDSGPRRHRYGTPRDLIVGIEVVLADGRIARAGGRVVKNVAGYDLSRLFCGSCGSLGVVTSATFKLAPLAAASQTVVGQFTAVNAALGAAADIGLSPITPSAIELQLPALKLLVRFETTASAARDMGQTAAGVLRRHGAEVSTLTGHDEQLAWDGHQNVVWRSQAVLKAAVLPTHVGTLLRAVESAGVDWNCVGRAALGVMLFGISGPDAAMRQAVESAQAAAAAGGGHVAVLAGPEPVRHLPLDPASPSVSVMRALKARFDPASIFPPLPGVKGAV